MIFFRSQAHYSVWNPLSIETIIGHLKGTFKNDILINGIDVVSDDILGNTKQMIEESDVIGFSISSYTLSEYKMFIKKLNLSSKFIIVGNQLATYLPKDILDLTIYESNADPEKVIIVRGEGEIPVQKICEYIMNGKGNLNDIPNLVFYSDKQLISTELKNISLKSLIHIPEYMNKGDINVIQMQLSRGCYWGNCSFCTRMSFRSGEKWESFSIDRIKADLYETIINHNVNNIEFCDDEFFGGRKNEYINRAYDICDYIEYLTNKRNRKVKFRIFTRLDFIFRVNSDAQNSKIRDLLLRMKQVGLMRIYIGIESACETQLKRYNRGMDKRVIKGALDTLKKLDINFDSGFIMFDPKLQLHEIIENITFYKENNLIETNQWIWRKMIANVGSSIGNKFLEANLKYDLDSMAVEYDYDDKIISSIFNIVDIKSAETRELFYTLKSISKKDYDYTDNNKYNYVAHELVKQNGAIYVELLDKIAKAILEADNLLSNLFEKVKEICSNDYLEENDKKKLREIIGKYSLEK